MPTTVIFEDSVASVAAEAQNEDLWLAPSKLGHLGWALAPEGLCREGSAAVKPGSRFVRSAP